MVENRMLLSEVNELAESAGILQSKGLVQSLSYSQNWMKEDYKLLELTSDLAKVLKEGDTLTIRGDAEDEAVICTSNKTYSIKAADTSNSLLLLPNLLTPAITDFSGDKAIVDSPVFSCFSTYYEVKPSRPNLERLRHMLNDNCYSNEKQNIANDQLTTNGLLSLIQSSEEELFQTLDGLGAFQIDGYWRILEINYQEKAFSQILALVEENSWGWKEIPLGETCQVLNELYPKFVLEHCLKIYGAEVDTEKRIFCLNEDKVCRYYAEYILRPALGKFNYHEFMTAWSESVPEGMTVSQEHLKGVSLTNLQNNPPVIWHFPEGNLPDNVGERFCLLFKARSKWEGDNIEPYLVNLLAPNQKLSSLYLKYTRCSKDENGVKVYSAK